MRLIPLAVLLALLSLPCVPARADDDPAAFSWQQHPGARLPLTASLHDETGQTIQLGSIFGRTPVILELGYYHCPSLCGVVRSDLVNALQNSNLVSGADYRLVSLSIDPTETALDAAQAKAADLAATAGTNAAGWHYWTGPASSVAAVARAVGFRDRYDIRFKQFMHPAGIVVLTADGVVSSYLLGVGYSSGDLRAAVLWAGQGGIAQASLPVLLLCFHYDPATGRYSLAIEKLLRLMAVLTVVTLGGLLILLHRHQPGRPT